MLIKNAFVCDFHNKDFLKKDIRINKNIIKDMDIFLNEKDGEHVVDLKDKYLVPVYIDSSTQIGLIESGQRNYENDTDDISVEDMSEFKTLDAIYPFDKYYRSALRNGIGMIVTNSGKDNVIGAQGCALFTHENFQVYNNSLVLKINLGNDTKKWKYNQTTKPLSRMGIAEIVNNKMLEFNRSDSKLSKRIKKKEIPILIRANKAQDILFAIRMKQEYGYKIIIEGASEAELLIKELREESIPLILRSVLRIDTSIESRRFSVDTIVNLINNDLQIAITTNHPETIVNLLPMSAYLLMSNGINYFDALRTITVNPAKMLGIKELGSIEKGKLANFIVYNDDPGSIYSKIESVYMLGKEYKI